MKPDLSRILFEKIITCKNRIIEVTLKNRTVIKGRITGFYFGDEECDQPYITRWHIEQGTDEFTLGVDAFGFLRGEIIENEDILTVKFCDDNSEMKFK